MVEVTYGGLGGRTFTFEESPGMLAVRAPRRRTRVPTTAARALQRLLRSFEAVLHIDQLGVSVYRALASDPAKARDLRDRLRAVFRRDEDVRYAGRVLQDPRAGLPVVYTEHLFVQFEGDAKQKHCVACLAEAGLEIRRRVDYAENAWYVRAEAGIGQDVFGLAQDLLRRHAVRLCHPEVLRPGRRRRAWPAQWHLHKTKVGGRTVDAHARVVEAWKHTRGKGVTIAVIDDGVDTDHPEFAGRGKVVHPRDVSRGLDSALPQRWNDDHGTACAGVACANGTRGAAGVAPGARLLPIRFEADVLGAQSEADAFAWAARQGADVISCSWGPADGAWWDPDDPLHRQVVGLPDATRLAIDYAVSKGRGGKGCVITWAAGNGAESVDLDGYASYEKVLAVAACNDRGRRSRYSDRGKALLCAFPSNDVRDAQPLTPGITTTDRRGNLGYNPTDDPRAGDVEPPDRAYTSSFGGTSSACPGVAGVAALVLAIDPELRWHEVRDLLRRSCDRIDPKHAAYDAQGHSLEVGHGRLNARKAVEKARAGLARRRGGAARGRRPRAGG